ncbi:MAG: hypothetical protein UT63_C0064G0012 [Candidatus Gottesmanbacteria bacterium GW2011_GWC2_39_8]|uniref:Ferrous iron transporter FeoA-like domain-containing protein n=1 Tax=Candidatus Gottesmanbacteria bacterium GW2011_GWC2_39_8 TaxID=1618450 RepID=A0A0G0SA66_9BACT|nr:MAG: hypothetical protein UT63_C0064G0012 [Candidatus Gottesmanbacteria bacterium GW2011_GWC2_39_8]
MKCSFCGYLFKENEGAGGCESCPIIHGCPLISCPNCGFEFPKSLTENNVMPLTEMKSGEKGVIHSVCTKDQTILAKIVAMGMLPGIKVGIKQKIPSLRCRFGYTEYAIDDSIAKVILVEKE